MITTSSKGHKSDIVKMYTSVRQRLVAWYYELQDEEGTDLYTNWKPATKIKENSDPPEKENTFLGKPEKKIPEIGFVDWTSTDGKIILTYDITFSSNRTHRYEGSSAGSLPINLLYHGGKVLTETPIQRISGAAIYKNKLIVVGDDTNYLDDSLTEVYMTDKPPLIYNRKEPLVLEWELMATHTSPIDPVSFHATEVFRRFNFNSEGSQAVSVLSAHADLDEEFPNTSIALLDINYDEDTEEYSATFNLNGPVDSPVETGHTLTQEFIKGTISVNISIIASGHNTGNSDSNYVSGNVDIYAKRGCSNGVDPIAEFDEYLTWTYGHYSDGGYDWALLKSTWTMVGNKTISTRSGGSIRFADYQVIQLGEEDYDEEDPKKQKIVYGIEKYSSQRIETFAISEYIKQWYTSVGSYIHPEPPPAFRRNTTEIQHIVGEEGLFLDGIDEIVPLDGGWLPNTGSSNDYVFPKDMSTEFKNSFEHAGEGHEGCWFTITKEDGDLEEDQTVVLEKSGGEVSIWSFVYIHVLDLRYRHLGYAARTNRNTTVGTTLSTEVSNPDYLYNKYPRGYSEAITSELWINVNYYLIINNGEIKNVYTEDYLWDETSFIGIRKCGENSDYSESPPSNLWITRLYRNEICCFSDGACFLQMQIWPYDPELPNWWYFYKLYTSDGIEVDPFEVSEMLNPDKKNDSQEDGFNYMSVI